MAQPKRGNWRVRQCCGHVQPTKRAVDTTTPKEGEWVCAKCREPITNLRRVVQAKDGALFHGRCWRNDK
jgi:predicted SprT family Zn-dependent metalloprotease